MGGSAVVGAEAFRRGSGFATGARPWLRSSSPLLSKRHTRWRVRSDANSAEVTRYVDQCVPVKLEKVPMELLILLLEKDGHLVTRQQIIERLWGNDVFVDTEHGINTAIRKIRQALKDDSDQPRFVADGEGQRLPVRRSCRQRRKWKKQQTPSFAAYVGPEAGTLSPDRMDGGAIPISPLQRAAGRSSAGSLRNIVLGTAVLIFLALLIVAWSRGWLHRSVRASTVTVQSVAVLPLDNLSGDKEQDFFADGMTDELITMLAKTSSLRVCERENIKAALNGTIAALGSQYVMSLEAVNCRNGDTLAREQVTADAKEKVLPALGSAASRLREKLGESLASIQKFDKPVEEVTTSSLGALKAYTQGAELFGSGQQLKAIPFFERAKELDPNFAAAYGELASIYSNNGEEERSLEYEKKAFALRDRVSEREKLAITRAYHWMVTGELDKEMDTEESWRQAYPRDTRPLNDLAVNHAIFLGQFEKGMEEANEAIRISTN